MQFSLLFVQLLEVWDWHPRKIYLLTKKSTLFGAEWSDWPKWGAGRSELHSRVISYLRSVLSNFLSLCVAEYKNRDENVSVHLKNTPRSPGRTWWSTSQNRGSWGALAAKLRRFRPPPWAPVTLFGTGALFGSSSCSGNLHARSSSWKPNAASSPPLFLWIPVSVLYFL